MSPMPPQPLEPPKKKKRARGRTARLLPPPRRSARIYLYLAPDKVHLFRYLLEAEDHLGLMTVVDRWRAALLLRYSPHREKDLLAFLEAARPLLGFVQVEGVRSASWNRLPNAGSKGLSPLVENKIHSCDDTA